MIARRARTAESTQNSVFLECRKQNLDRSSLLTNGCLRDLLFSKPILLDGTKAAWKRSILNDRSLGGFLTFNSSVEL